MTNSNPDLKNIFLTCLRPDSILDQANDLAFYGKDSCKQYQANPSLILLPENEQQVQQIIQKSLQHNIALVPSGGRTGYSGAATATQGEVVISLSKLNKILEIKVDELTLRCQSGATTESVRSAAANHNLQYPVDFASRGSSHIGGNIATNAGGIRVIRYGNTRDWVLGLRVVTGTAEILELNGALYKNQSGYDLKSLIIGSEGTLGIITEATLKLTTLPKESTLALLAIDSTEVALSVLAHLRAKAFTVNVFEYFERNALELVINATGAKDPFDQQSAAYALVEVEKQSQLTTDPLGEVLAELIESGTVRNVVIADNSKQAQSLMALRERISESIAKFYMPHKNDISVPVSAIPKFLMAYRECLAAWPIKYEVIVFGHIGDGNLHLNVLKPETSTPQEFFVDCDALDLKTFEIVAQFKGSISAEHGVGLLKRQFLNFSRSATEIEMMRQIKKIFDPQGILNPGKIF